MHTTLSKYYISLLKNIYGKMRAYEEYFLVHFLFTHLSHVTDCLYMYQTLKFCKILKRIAIFASISL